MNIKEMLNSRLAVPQDSCKWGNTETQADFHPILNIQNKYQLPDLTWNWALSACISGWELLTQHMTVHFRFSCKFIAQNVLHMRVSKRSKWVNSEWFPLYYSCSTWHFVPCPATALRKSLHPFLFITTACPLLATPRLSSTCPLRAPTPTYHKIEM